MIGSAGQSGIIKAMDVEDATVLVDLSASPTTPPEGEGAGDAATAQVAKDEEGEKEAKEKEEAVTFESAPIKHIKDKTLAPFKKKFKTAVVMFYRGPTLCGHCAAVKPAYARVADHLDPLNKDKNFAFAAIDCGHAKKAPLKPLWCAH